MQSQDIIPASLTALPEPIFPARILLGINMMLNPRALNLYRFETGQHVIRHQALAGIV
jgi:hypothetical protein